MPVKPASQTTKIKLKVGDKVVVLSGKYKGTESTVTKVHPKLNKVTVENVNVVKKHVKASDQSKLTSGIHEITKPIWTNKVAIIEPKSGKPSRISYKTAGDKKERVYRKTGGKV